MFAHPFSGYVVQPQEAGRIHSVSLFFVGFSILEGPLGSFSRYIGTVRGSLIDQEARDRGKDVGRFLVHLRLGEMGSGGLEGNVFPL